MIKFWQHRWGTKKRWWLKQNKHRHSLKIDHCYPTLCLTSCIRNSHCEGHEFINFDNLSPLLVWEQGLQPGKYCNLRTNLSAHFFFPSPLARVLAISACYRVISILKFYTCWTLSSRRSLWPGGSRGSCRPYSVASWNTGDSRDARWPLWARGTRRTRGARHWLFFPCKERKKKWSAN